VHQTNLGSGTEASCGSVITLQCDTCYAASSSSPSSQFNGTHWNPDYSNFTCALKNDWCPSNAAAPAPGNGASAGSGTKCGDTRTYTCNTCYNFNKGQGDQSRTSTCQSDHSWSLVDLSCHAMSCDTLPAQAANAAPWATQGTGSGCGANINTSCNSGYAATSGDLERHCVLVNDSISMYNGSNPVCTFVTPSPTATPTAPGATPVPTATPTIADPTLCQGPFAEDAQGMWEYTNGSWVNVSVSGVTTLVWQKGSAVSFGYVSTNISNVSAVPIGTTATLTCNSCFASNNNTNPHQRTCTYNGWTSSAATCTNHYGICDAQAIGPNAQLLASYSYASSGTTGSSCGDTIAYSCADCAKFNVTPYPDPERMTITRTCQSNGTWTGPALKCTYDDYKTYSTNMLLYEASRTGTFGYKKSPYECQYNLTMCPECQTNINTKCAAEAPKSTQVLAACGTIAKNLCPKKCNSNTEICPDCLLTTAGITQCAATGKCLCGPSWGGDGCEVAGETKTETAKAPITRPTFPTPAPTPVPVPVAATGEHVISMTMNNVTEAQFAQPAARTAFKQTLVDAYLSKASITITIADVTIVSVKTARRAGISVTTAVQHGQEGETASLGASAITNYLKTDFASEFSTAAQAAGVAISVTSVSGVETTSPIVVTPVEDTKIEYTWWLYLLIALIGGCGVYCFGIYFWVQSREGKTMQPHLGDSCYPSGLLFYIWYYFLFGCFCTSNEQVAGMAGIEMDSPTKVGGPSDKLQQSQPVPPFRMPPRVPVDNKEQI